MAVTAVKGDAMVKIVEALLARGADPNAGFESKTPALTSVQGDAPLLILVRNCFWGRQADPTTLRAVELLLKRGARTDLRDPMTKKTPLASAREAGLAPLAELLERHGARE